MSLLGWVGRAFQIAIDGAPIAAVRTKRVGYANAPIDITDGENNGYRRIAERGDVRSIEVTVEGVCTVLNWPRLYAEYQADEFSPLEIWHPDGSVQVMSAFLSNLSRNGEHNGAVGFAATWLLSGESLGVLTLTLTSRPYAVEAEEGVRLVRGVPGAPGWVWNDIAPDALEVAPITPLGGALYGGGETYSDALPEALDVVQLAPLGGSLYGGGVTYENWPDEALEVGQVLPLGGALYGDGVTYDNWPDEALDVAQLTPLGGTLT